RARRSALAPDHLRVARRERAGEVVRAPGRSLRAERADGRRRASWTDAGPYGKALVPHGYTCGSRSQTDEDLARAPAPAALDRGSGRLLLGRAADRRGDAALGLGAADPRRQSEPHAHGARRRARADGRAE